MAFWDFLKRPVPVAVFSPHVTHLGAEEFDAYALGQMSPAEMWATQPHLRTVVSFLARNIAQLGLHSFERDGEDRKRDRESAFARAMRRPNESQTGYDLIFSLVGDIALYDRAYWHVGVNADSGEPELRRLPPSWVTPVWADAFRVKAYTVAMPGGSGSTDVPAGEILAFTGYHPSSARLGSPTVEALKGTLQEQIESSKYRQQVWKRGGRVSAVIERPKDAPAWTDEQARRFREDWYANYTGDGPRAGGTPILEDGMSLNRIDFTAQEQQFVEATKLSFATVASAFHVNPTMVGILDNANYSNVREFRRMLYGDTLGPLIAQIEARINAFLLPVLGMDSDRFYVEFNIAEKLQGSFEEQATVMQTLVGAPLMTRDEGRARFNLPAIEGGDQLVTPLNVLIGGQASPTDSGSQNVRSGPVRVKAAPPESHREQYERVLKRYFRRQRDAVLSALGAKADAEWWDAERWDRELATDLYRLALLTTEQVGRETAEALGFSADTYDVPRTLAFLKAVAESRASLINATTYAQIEDALGAEDSSAADVFDQAEDSRRAEIATTLLTTFGAFASAEAGKQAAGDRATKTWVTTSRSPRSSHAQMNGETVGIEEKFSNGMDWPGDPAGGADEVAGCQCSVDISVAGRD